MNGGMLGFHPIQIGYILVFGFTALLCFAVIPRALSRIQDKDTRVGLVSLLALSGLWATFHVGRLAISFQPLKLTFYILGLTVGLATVGAWLYFCSAYAGEPYHRERRFRALALVIFLAIVGIKFTSPIHGLYYSTTLGTTPFLHLDIQLKPFHWIVTGFSYALSAIGFYMLFDLFRESNYATKRLGGLVGLAALPVLFDLVGYISPGVIIKLNYEPIGVGLFALGVLYVADGSFLAARRFGREQLLDEIDEAVVVVDPKGTIRDVNERAKRTFPTLDGAIGAPLAATAPALEAHLQAGDSKIVTFDESDRAEHYLFSTKELTVGQTHIGRALLFTDITEVERQRRAVEQHQQQFDEFAEAITHELRNTLGIVQGHLELAATQIDREADSEVAETIDTVVTTADRMVGIVTDLATMAEFGRPVETTSKVDVAPVAWRAWDSLAPSESELVISEPGAIEAHDIRLERLFRNLFTFAVGNGATQVHLTTTDRGLVVTDDGAPIAEHDTEAAFKYGSPVPSAESGMLLPVVRTLAEAHGWTVTIDTTYEAGVRVVIEV